MKIHCLFFLLTGGLLSSRWLGSDELFSLVAIVINFAWWLYLMKDASALRQIVFGIISLSLIDVAFFSSLAKEDSGWTYASYAALLAADLIITARQDYLKLHLKKE